MDTKLFGLMTMEEELKKTVDLAQKSDMTYVRTEVLSVADKILIGFPVYVKVFNVLVAGTTEQFNDLTSDIKNELTRLF